MEEKEEKDFLEKYFGDILVGSILVIGLFLLRKEIFKNRVELLKTRLDVLNTREEMLNMGIYMTKFAEKSK